jgi:alpha-glucosidase
LAELNEFAGRRTAMTIPWWRSGVLYQIYPRSFADSNGDGIGDIRGVIGKLDHLEWLGVDGIWLSPVTVSPNADWGYDVAGYCDVDPAYGTLADLDELIADAGRRNIRILLDLVANHTSDRHPWFVDARSSRDAEHRDWYVWADPKPDGSPPNNWLSNFGGPAWTIDDNTGQAYLHNFAPEQPDLNWWNDDVRTAIDDVFRFWYDRGIAGFRLDVCHMLVKDADLRDNPPITDQDAAFHRRLGQKPLYNSNRPELHDVLRRWRKVADSYDPPRVLLGESVVLDLQELSSYYGTDDELHLPMNVPFMHGRLDANRLRAVVEGTEALIPPSAWPVWAGANHDMSRMATRWARGDERKVRAALVMLLTLRGTPLLYQGDEIGMPDTGLTRDDLRDPVGVKFWPKHNGRDPARTPMAWSSEAGGGFTSADVTPWLPFGDLDAGNVADQRDDPDSTLHLTRDLIALRGATPALLAGSYETLPAPDGTWVWRRDDDVVVAINLSDDEASVRGVDGHIAISTVRSRDGQSTGGTLQLAPCEAVVVRRSL